RVIGHVREHDGAGAGRQPVLLRASRRYPERGPRVHAPPRMGSGRTPTLLCVRRAWRHRPGTARPRLDSLSGAGRTGPADVTACPSAGRGMARRRRWLAGTDLATTLARGQRTGGPAGADRGALGWRTLNGAGCPQPSSSGRGPWGGWWPSVSTA